MPEQDQGPRRRARPAPGRHPGGHRQARPRGLLRRCDRGRPGGRRRASRRSRRSGCERWPRCSPETFSKAWRSTAARPSTAGSPRSGAGSAAATPRCWSTSSAAFPTTRRSAIWRSGCELAPFDRRVHELLLNALARRGRIREGEEHLAATARLFEAEGLDCAPIRDAWRAAQSAGGQLAARPSRRSPLDGRGEQRPRRHRRRRAAPRLHRGDAVRRPVRRDAASAAALPTRSPTT